jgi:MFS transporter, DHA1 family, tetracycline resistance protein
MFRSPLFPIFLTVFVDVLGLTLVLPLLPFYAEDFGASPIVIGALVSSFAACQFISGPILGRLSDRVGRKPVLLVSQCGTLAAFLMLGFANSLVMLFVGRIIDGFTAGNLSIAQAYISDVTASKNRTRAFGLIGIAFGTGFLFGPVISGLLAQINRRVPFFVAAALSLTSIVVTATLLPAKPRRAEPSSPEIDVPPPAGERSFSFGRFFSQPLPRRRLLQFFAFSLSFSALLSGLALFLERRFSYNVRDVGFIFGFSGFIGMIVQGGLIGRLVKRLGEARLTMLGFITMAIGYGFLGFVDKGQVLALLSLVAIAGFGSAVVRPCITTLLTKSVGRGEQGAALGLSQSLTSIAQMTAPLAATFLIEHQRLAAYGLTAASFAAIGALLSLLPAPASA